MPKSNFLRKKSKSGSTADFKRLKAKVGKRAPQAANHTDTSFKSKRVRVSAQSILHEAGEGEIVTARGQGVQELLVQLRHYSSASKREALVGLKGIVDRHPRFAEVNFARLAEGSLELAICVDNDVRKSLLAYQEALLQRVSEEIFTPFANIYLAYVVSAMTSLDKWVRRDSLALLELLLAHFPSAVADRADRVTPNYTTLLAVDPASKKQTGRKEALRSLAGLLRAVSTRLSVGGRVGDGESGAGTGGQGGVRRTTELRWRRDSCRNSALVLLPCAIQPNTGDGGLSRELKGGSAAEAIACMLPPILEKVGEVWMEAVAAVPPDLEQMQGVTDVLLEVTSSPAWGRSDPKSCEGGKSGKGSDSMLSGPWKGDSGTAAKAAGGVQNRGTAMEKTPSSWFAGFVPVVLQTFPVRALEGEMLGNEEVERARTVNELNMGLCELVVSASTWASPAPAPVAPRGKAADTPGHDTAGWLMPVLAHVHEVLRTGRCDGGADAQVSRVLRVVSAAMHRKAGSGSESWATQRQRLLSAFGEFFVSLPPRTKSNLLCVKYICALTLRLLSVSDADWRLAAVEPDVFRQVCRWLRSLPELLCQWEGEFPEVSANILRVLVELAKRSPSQPPGASAERKESLNSRKGSGKGAVGADPGAKAVNTSKTATSGTAAATVASPATGTPSTGVGLLNPSEVSQVIPPTLLREFFSGRGFLSLRIAAQTDAVSLLYHIPSISVEVISTLAAVCSQPAALHNDVRSFIMEVIHHRRRSLTPSIYLEFLVSVLLGVGDGNARQPGAMKRTADRRGGANQEPVGGSSKRRRRHFPSESSGVRTEEEKSTPSGQTPPTLWESVFSRDQVTGAVCNSLAMLGTRGRALLGALQSTLLQLLQGCKAAPAAAGVGGKDRVDVGKSVASGHAVDRIPDEAVLVEALQRQRAAMACVLCLWEGLNADSSPSTTAGEDDSGASTAGTPAMASPLSVLEEPVAAACVQAMKVAGRVDAREEGRGARLLRPVLVLVKRWHALLPVILGLIVTTIDADGALRSAEPFVRCLQSIVSDSWIREHLRRRHLVGLREAVKSICRKCDGSPLHALAVQLRADVELLGGALTQPLSR